MTKHLDEGTQATDSILDYPSQDPGQVESFAQPPTRAELLVDDSGAVLCYANFCRVTGTPEELVLDFGLNSQAVGAATTVEIKQRLVVNYYTAKRLFHALGLSIQRHETAFGILETDVQKRIRPAIHRPASAD